MGLKIPGIMKMNSVRFSISDLDPLDVWMVIMKSGFYSSKSKQNHSLELLNLLFKHIFRKNDPKMAMSSPKDFSNDFPYRPLNRRRHELSVDFKLLLSCHVFGQRARGSAERRNRQIIGNYRNIIRNYRKL